MQRRVAVALALVVLLGVGVPAGTGAVSQPRVTTPPEFDSTTFEITVYANETARWTFEHTRPLNDSERQQYRDFAERFNSENLSFYETFRDRARRLVSAGRNATDRNMTARQFSKQASIDELGNRGIVRMSFMWTNFARQTEGDVLVGDVFEGGLYIGADQRLVIGAGPALSFSAVEPTPDVTSGASLTDSDSVTWRGERVFSDEHPRVRLSPAAGVTTRTGSVPTTTTRTTSQGATATTPTTTMSAENRSMGMAMVAVLLLAIALGGAVLWRSGGFGGSRETGGGTAPDAGAAAGTRTQAAAQSGIQSTTQNEGVAEEELLSDTDRVLQMLESNGGQMKQVAIVENTDWSKSKVSMLLSDMEDDGHISKLRVGRENIISLRGHEPEAAGSPFEDE
jgi:hypothetical protein